MLCGFARKLHYLVRVSKCDLPMAMLLLVLEQYGGADDGLAAALQYLNQRNSIPPDKGIWLLADMGAEDLD